MGTKFFQKQDTLAFIAGPILVRSTHLGLRMELFQVWVGGKVAFHAPSQETCREWLVRQGYFPRR
jgi:hypothetical protein